jgi:hypothetical protein
MLLVIQASFHSSLQNKKAGSTFIIERQPGCPLGTRGFPSPPCDGFGEKELRLKKNKSPLRRFFRSGLSGPSREVGKVTEIRFSNTFKFNWPEYSVGLLRLL